MKLGFIGAGKITSSVVTGICNSKISFSKILVSPRNRSIAKKLSKRFKKVNISKNNQEIINKCDWIFLAITPAVGTIIIKDLKFRSNQTIISFISTITLAQLKKMIKVKAKIIRAIPLPPISLKKGPVPIYPPNKKVKNFFDKIGSNVGLLFQIADDVIDYQGSSKVAGKKTGKDKKKGKATLISLLGYKNAIKYSENIKFKIISDLDRHNFKSNNLNETLNYILKRNK